MYYKAPFYSNVYVDPTEAPTIYLFCLFLYVCLLLSTDRSQNVEIQSLKTKHPPFRNGCGYTAAGFEIHRHRRFSRCVQLL